LNTYQQICGEQDSTAAARSFVRIFTDNRIRASGKQGQSFAEYAVILGLVVLAGAAGFSGFGAALGTLATDTVGAVIAFL
jgi:Flp pilus assembly pilin Flp